MEEPNTSRYTAMQALSWEMSLSYAHGLSEIRKATQLARSNCLKLRNSGTAPGTILPCKHQKGNQHPNIQQKIRSPKASRIV